MAANPNPTPLMYKRVQHEFDPARDQTYLHVRVGLEWWRVTKRRSTRMNRLSGIRIFRSWTKVRIAEPPASGLHSKPSKEPRAPSQHEADENSTKQATTRLRKGSPEDRARQSEIMKGVWARPGVREDRSAIASKAWTSENRALRSKSMKRMWTQPGFREDRSAAYREASTPEVRARRAKATKRMWAQPELREKRSAAIREGWRNSQKKAVFASALMSRWKIPENKDAFKKNRLFRRDDDDPRMKNKWEKMGTISRTGTLFPLGLC
jgi:hypothetical protein